MKRFSLSNKMKKYKSILIILFFITSINYGGEIRDRAEDVIKNNFSDSCQVNVFKFHVENGLRLNAEKHAKQRFFGKFVFYYEIIENDEIVGYAILDNVLGKVKPITFIVICDQEKSIKSVEVIKYREQHGGTVAKRSWLDQFNNGDINSKFELDEDIDGISGATISVKSLLKGVKKIMYLVNNLGEDERNLLTSIK